MRRLRFLSISVGLLAVAGLAPAAAYAGNPDDADLPTDASDGEDGEAIFNGNPAPTCSFPTTVAVTGGGGLCTGTLIAPEIVVYAAHCGGGNKTIRFSESSGGGAGQTMQTEFCMTNPGYFNQGTDYAFCKLASAAPVPVTPAVYGCEGPEVITQGQPVVIAGFGNNTTQGGGGVGAGTKRWGTSVLGVPNYNGNTVPINGYCQGDSGGPSFVQYQDGSWHAVSIVSTGSGCPGGGAGGLNALIAGAIPFIEENSGVDATPCFDVQGNWTPNPTCGGFLAGDAGVGTGTWGTWCEGTPTSGSSDTCGPAYDAEPDDTPPTVSITAPEMVVEFDDAPAPVDFEISANDDGWGVQYVALEIDGEEQAVQDLTAPYSFVDVTFPQGAYTVRAVAYDWAGNVGFSDAVLIGVGEEAPEPPMDEGGDGDGDGDGDGEDGGVEEGTGTTAGIDDGGEGCSCAAATDGRSGAAWVGLGLIGLAGFTRRRRR